LIKGKGPGKGDGKRKGRKGVMKREKRREGMTETCSKRPGELDTWLYMIIFTA